MTPEQEQELLDRVWDDNADPFCTALRIRVMNERRRRNGEDGPAGVREPRRPLPTSGRGATAVVPPVDEDETSGAP